MSDPYSSKKKWNLAVKNGNKYNLLSDEEVKTNSESKKPITEPKEGKKLVHFEVTGKNKAGAVESMDVPVYEMPDGSFEVNGTKYKNRKAVRSALNEQYRDSYGFLKED